MEDLGLITRAVRELRDALGYPGMRVLQFAFSGPKNIFLPHNYVAHTVTYTGTHDNDTSVGWFEQAPEAERHVHPFVRRRYPLLLSRSRAQSQRFMQQYVGEFNDNISARDDDHAACDARSSSGRHDAGECRIVLQDVPATL